MEDFRSYQEAFHAGRGVPAEISGHNSSASWQPHWGAPKRRLRVASPGRDRESGRASRGRAPENRRAAARLRRLVAPLLSGGAGRRRGPQENSHRLEISPCKVLPSIYI
jgi:hypothetical protein